MDSFFTPNLLSRFLTALLISLPLSVQSQSGEDVLGDKATVDSSKYAVFDKLEKANFNDGLVLDPLQLIQAKFPSLLIARGGNDPNGQFDLRMRGVTSFNATEPLILLDGMAFANLQL